MDAAKIHSINLLRFVHIPVVSTPAYDKHEASYRVTDDSFDPPAHMPATSGIDQAAGAKTLASGTLLPN